MVTFRNNSNNRQTSTILEEMIEVSNLMERDKNLASNFTSSDNFKRKSPGRNNHNAP